MDKKQEKAGGLTFAFNPMSVKENRRPLAFASYDDAYDYAFSFIRDNYPEGYVEVPLLLVEMCGMNEREANIHTRIWKRSRQLPEIIKFNFAEPDGADVEYYTALFYCLHELSGATFNEGIFTKALKRHFLEINTIKQLKENESN